MPSNSSNLPLTLKLLSTAQPPSTARAWQSATHPRLPLIATACADKTVRIYSLTSFTLLSTITGGHRRSVRCCAWKPTVATKGTDGAVVLATGSFDASAAIWVHEGGGHGEHDNEDGEGTEAEDGDEGEDYRFAVVLEGHDSEIKSVAWSAHGTFLATCSRDKSVWIWESLDPEAEDEDSYETVAVLQEHDGDVKCVAWHPADERCLASSSYDDAVRVWREDAESEWGCVAVCEGHEGTVWCVDWEAADATSATHRPDRVEHTGEENDTEGETAISGPRLISSSDDCSVRVWRRTPKAVRPEPVRNGPRIPSSIRPAGQEEEWSEEARLPGRHDRAVYAVAWSRVSGRVVSAGSDGKIVVYEERALVSNGGGDESTDGPNKKTEWVVLAEVEAAHGVFEVNHVCWARRFDRGKRTDDEEVVVSTGDDGEVKIWIFESA